MPTKRNFTGQYLDDTGLLFYNARYYDPGIGRFISVDTIVPGAGSLTMTGGAGGGGPGNPQQLNRYTYVLNSPVNKTDPTGHASKDGAYSRPLDIPGGGGSYGTGGGGSAVGPIAGIFVQQMVKTVAQAAGSAIVNAGKAALANPEVRKAGTEALINGVLSMGQSLISDGYMGGERGWPLAEKMAIAGGIGAASGAFGSIAKTPLGQASLSSVTGLGMTYAATQPSGRDMLRLGTAEVLSTPIGLSASQMPRHLVVPVLVLQTVTRSFVETSGKPR